MFQFPCSWSDRQCRKRTHSDLSPVEQTSENDRMVRMLPKQGIQDSITLTLTVAPESLSSASTTMTDQNKIEEVPVRRTRTLVDLPAEIIHQILSCLSAQDLACISSTCRILRDHGNNNLLWADLVNENLPTKIKDPGPFDSFRSLYLAHYPYWFVPRNKIWFADTEHTGKIILARYDNRRGVVEGFRLVAERGPESFEEWEHDAQAVIQSFKPTVRLWLDDPVLHLKNSTCEPPHRRQYLHGEFRMPMAVESQNIYSSFSLCAASMPVEYPAIVAARLWPPSSIPSDDRVFRGGGGEWGQWNNRPQHLTGISEKAFRVRKWAHFRMGLPIFPNGNQQSLSTFATLDPSLYMPTKEKPYQGIWVGDYSFHGCEFLLFVQREKKPTREDRSRTSSLSELSLSREGQELVGQADDATIPASRDSSNTLNPIDTADHDQTYKSGRLEAIKLTGDPNVPRGELSFVAEDIGLGGLIRIAQEKQFKGARVVRSKGHIANRNFRDDKWVDAQMILISHDCIAQYWESMHHISFFQRVDIDQLLSV